MLEICRAPSLNFVLAALQLCASKAAITSKKSFNSQLKKGLCSFAIPNFVLEALLLKPPLNQRSHSTFTLNFLFIPNSNFVPAALQRFSWKSRHYIKELIQLSTPTFFLSQIQILYFPPFSSYPNFKFCTRRLSTLYFKKPPPQQRSHSQHPNFKLCTCRPKKSFNCNCLTLDFGCNTKNSAIPSKQLLNSHIKFS